MKYSINDKTYVFVEKIAEGGYAFVEKVQDPQTGTFYALKKMFVQDESLVKASKMEVKLWKSLGSHPNIVKYEGSAYF